MTKSLLQFEKEFGKYQSTFKADYSIEYKLITILNFWGKLKNSLESNIYQSYLQLYRQDFNFYLVKKNLHNLTFDELRSFFQISNILKLNEKSEIIAERIITLFCYVGDLSSAIEMYNEHFDENIKMSKQKDSVLVPFEKLENYCETISKDSIKAYQFFIKIKDLWKSKSDSLSNKIVNCILVEKTDTYQRGELCELKCEVDDLSKRVTDNKISLNDELKSKDDPFVGVIYNSIDTVKSLFTRFQNIPFHAHFNIINNSQKVSGDSIGLASAAVMYTNLLKDEVQRYERFLSGEVVLTGSLDKLGNILPINEDSLSYKIERIFFSHINYLVVPEESYEIAKQILSELNKNYPNRKLILSSVKSFTDILRDKNIIRSEKLCPLEYITKQTIKYSRMTKVQVPLLLVLITLFTAIVFPKFMPWFDWNIVDIEAKGNRFRTMNANGQTIWWSEFKFGDLHNQIEVDGSYSKDYFYAFDYDKNGKDELFFVPFKLHREGVIQFYNDQGEFVWEELGYDTLSVAKQVESKLNGNPHILPLDGSGAGYIITESWLLSEPLCWQQFQLYDKSGKVGGVYTFPGVSHLIEPIAQLVDIDNDGIVELLIGGTSINGNGSSVLVLNPFNLSGVAPPYNENFIESDLKKGSQKYYISIPKTPLCYNKNIKSDIRYLWYNDLTGQIDIQVFEGINLFLNNKLLGTEDRLPILLYEFDKNFIPNRIRLTDEAYLVYESYWRELGNMEPIDFEQLFDSLKSEVVVYYGDSIVHHLAAGIDFYKNKK